MAMHQGACFSVFLAAFLLGICDGRIHKLELKNETRYIIHLNTFGFYANGTLDFNLTALSLPREQKIDYPMGFSLSKSRVNGVLSYTAEDTEKCKLTTANSAEPLILFLIDIHNLRVNVRSFAEEDSILTESLKAKEEAAKEEAAQAPGTREKRGTTTPVQSHTEEKDGATKQQGTAEGKDKQSKDKPLEEEGRSVTDKPAQSVRKIDGMTFALRKNGDSYSFSFHMRIGSQAEGLYNLNFHSCNSVPGVNRPYNINVEIIEQNPGGFLSAAEIPLPLLYISMAGVFFIAALVWVYTLMKHRYSVFKIHWLMAALAFTKSISLVFHSINYHFINTKGHPIEGWAVMYYITHLLKGALLFITLALIGTGWAFVKYILSDKEKKIFMIVIPLQVLANVAYIIIESTEEGSSEYALWKEVLFLVDLICCGAILFPVVWSIRHLQDASSTDGKAAAMNLEKLKLFRHYYVMIVCYIYFTRIIAILLKVTIPFQWQWFYEFLVEVSTLIFFVLTGYKFRPASNNPYLQLPQDEEDVEMDEVVTESGVLEGISRVKKTHNGRIKALARRSRNPHAWFGRTAGMTDRSKMASNAGLVLLLLAVTSEASVGPSNSSSFCTETEECLLFDLVCKTKEYEVRRYGPARWVSTDAEALFMEVGGTVAFRRLYKYITGANEEGVKINMTAPILVKIPEERRMWKATVYTLSFLLPSAYQESPPEPTNEKVYFTDMPDMTVYVRSYGGWILSVTSGLQSHLLRKDLNTAHASYNNSFNFAVGYDSPMKLLHRHNEVWYVSPNLEDALWTFFLMLFWRPC
ncbi:hypothetical protein AAFF_G00199900 [Aldrovandia affinis]|uniref:Heme-binding protein 1 n=1 Tax=Aldrovandia affinis TaxID=143900 RepID=A0AAD7W602_9TELE|nr:hypothetical protein AAFF_G00199900 [Aldrovandia affinis]